MDLKNFLKNLPTTSGVYSMQDCNNQIIYIGKAKNLKNRIKSYFSLKNSNNISPKTTALVSEIKNIEITVTKNETEALLLENQLINKLKPKYNVIFRDDKSYPYILLTNDLYPSLIYCRGKRYKKNGTLYGPYPNIKAVKTSLNILSKVFKLRTCNNSFFANRTRPCLEYQLKRCSAPCVGLIKPELYAQDVENVTLFLQNKSKILLKNLTLQMNKFSNALDYDSAAIIRDQIAALSVLHKEQAVVNKQAVDLDVIGLASSPKLICVHLLRIKQGDLLYSKQFFSKNTGLTINNTDAYFLEEFIMQHYLNSDLAENSIVEILIATKIKNMELIAKTIKIKLVNAKKGDKLAWQQIAQNSAQQGLFSRVSEYNQQKNNFIALAELIGRKKPMERIACFDVSHTCGKETIAVCVVFNVFGRELSSYRLFNIKNLIPGDDYNALQQAIFRYMEQIVVKPELAPSLLIVDGGKGQLKVAEQVINNFKKELYNNNLIINLLGIAKGQDRKPGLEKLYLNSEGAELNLQSTNQVFKLLQKIRDAAHNFAISSHRKKRDKLYKK